MFQGQNLLKWKYHRERSAPEDNKRRSTASYQWLGGSGYVNVVVVTCCAVALPVMQDLGRWPVSLWNPYSPSLLTESP